jgi:23S rRNA (adenine2503-C2)-methyltransferase
MKKLKLLKVITVFESKDGVSKKLVQAVTTGKVINATIETGRYTVDYEDVVCLSTQIGCNMGCVFCASTKPFEYQPGIIRRKLRNLTSDEIFEQAVNALQYFPAIFGNNKIVFSYMGMGEPFDNIAEVKKSITLLAKKYPNSRVTISTIGFSAQEIIKLGKEVKQNKYDIPVKIHISLHAPCDIKRKKIVPNAGLLKDVLIASNRYAELTGNKVKLNYVLARGANDSDSDARQLGRLLKGRNNFILKLSDLNSPNGNGVVSKERVDEFEAIVKRYNIQTCRFTSHGQDIDAGCGRLVKGIEISSRLWGDQTCD